MDKVVNSLIIELIKSPIIVFFLIIGVSYILFVIIKKVDWLKKSHVNSLNKCDSVEVKKCPKCGASLLIRKGKYGKFYGCSNYPKCKYTLDYIEENMGEKK